MNDTSTILCSGIALGVYTPALLYKKNIENEHKTADIVALESVFSIEKQEQLQRNKILFHQNFKLAKLAHRLPPAMSQHYDKQKADHLMEKWLDEKRSHFTVFSGFWIPLLEEYIAKSGREDIAVECIHMDAGLSPSWKRYVNSCDKYHNTWLWGDECIKTIPAGSDFEILAYEQRGNRLIVHGGGWGMGNFKEKVSCLANCEYELDIVKYEMVEEDESDIAYYRIDPAWVPWESYEFPPMLYGKGSNLSKMDARNYHNMLEISRRCKGIVSKPGGATLLDSILSATPLIMLEPLGEHEQRNAEIWKKYGFGISVEDWEKSHFSHSILSELHNNLLEYQEKIKPIQEGMNNVTTKNIQKTR